VGPVADDLAHPRRELGGALVEWTRQVGDRRQSVGHDELV
jgi:hypothetical protein